MHRTWYCWLIDKIVTSGCVYQPYLCLVFKVAPIVNLAIRIYRYWASTTYRQSVLQWARYQLCHNEHVPLRVKWCLRMLQYSCGCCSMLLPSLLLTAYGNNRKEEVASMKVFHHHRRWNFAACPVVNRFPMMVATNSWTSRKWGSRLCLGFNDACTYRIQRRIELMIAQIPSLSLRWFIYKLHRYQHVNIRNRIANWLRSYRCNFTCFV